MSSLDKLTDLQLKGAYLQRTDLQLDWGQQAAQLLAYGLSKLLASLLGAWQHHGR